MTAVATLTGAPCYEVEIDWNLINWKKVNHNVRRLQARSATRSSETAVIDNGGWRARVR
jgi:hypothetical protein